MEKFDFEFLDSPYALREIIRESAALGAIAALITCGSIKPYMKKAEAYQKFKRWWVDKWIDEGMVTIRKDGNHSAAWRIDRLEIESVACALRLQRFFNN